MIFVHPLQTYEKLFRFLLSEPSQVLNMVGNVPEREEIISLFSRVLDWNLEWLPAFQRMIDSSAQSNLTSPLEALDCLSDNQSTTSQCILHAFRTVSHSFIIETLAATSSHSNDEREEDSNGDFWLLAMVDSIQHAASEVPV